jgi:GNAT superfamily N-acetyltransferase
MMTTATIHTRTATADDSPAIARIHLASWRRGIEDSTSSQAIFVAESSEAEIIGFVASGPERTCERPGYTGELYAIYVPDGWHGHGVGRLLMREGARELLYQGHTTSMLIWALTENPACDFYRYLGGAPIATQNVTLGQKPLDETAFGWENIAVQ